MNDAEAKALLERPLFQGDFINSHGLSWPPEQLNRNNERAKRIFQPDFGHIAGKSVLDLGARHGAWCWAALQLGADFTMGVEARPQSIARGRQLFDGIGSDRHRMAVGDVFEKMPELLAHGYRFDTVLCLGFFYHIYDHYLLMRLMHAFGPKHIVIDSEMHPSQQAVSYIRLEQAWHPNNAIPNVAGQQRVPVGNISKGGLEALAFSLGYDVHWCDWTVPEERKSGLDDYLAENRRFTAILTSKS